MTWLLSPSGWPVFADTGDEQADLLGRGYDVIAEADVQAAIDAFHAAEASPPSEQLPGWALASDVAAALATKANASSLPGKLSISDIDNPASDGGARLRAALGSFVPVTRFGAGTGKTAAQNAAALLSAIDSGEPLFVPPAEFLTDQLTVDGPLTLLGSGRDVSTLRNPSGAVLSVAGSGIDAQGLGLRSDGGGATITQHGHVDQGAFDRVRFVQGAADESIWDNAGFHYIDMRVSRSYSQHRQDATVPGWKLVAAGGTLNNNVWEKVRAQYSGEYHFHVESTDANAQYANTFRDTTFEVCTGGGIRLISVAGYEIRNVTNWDMEVGTPSTGQRHFISAERNTDGINCSGTLAHLQRLAGTNAPGVYDVSLPAAGGGSGTIIEFCRNVSAADPFTINDLGNPLYLVDAESVGRTQLLDGSGAFTIDGYQGLSIGGKKLRQGTAAPIAGTWARGDKVWNTAPSAGGFEGWICVAAGTPGTWQTFGAITA